MKAVNYCSNFIAHCQLLILMKRVILLPKLELLQTVDRERRHWLLTRERVSSFRNSGGGFNFFYLDTNRQAVCVCDPVSYI